MKLLCMFLLDTLIIQIWSNSCLFYTEKAPKSQGFFVLFNFQPLVPYLNDTIISFFKGLSDGYHAGWF